MSCCLPEVKNNSLNSNNQEMKVVAVTYEFLTIMI